MTRRRTIAALVALMAAVFAPASAQPDPFAPLRFLLGEWEAIDTPNEHGGFTFALTVQNRLMTRTNNAVYDATSSRPASRHDDFMVIYPENGSLRAEYFDNEGHVIHYDVTSRRDREAVFSCAATAKEPGYRLSYVLMPEGLLKGQFEVAPPGLGDAFKPYLSWTARRTRGRM